MSDQNSTPAHEPRIAASGQGLLDRHVFYQAVKMTRMAMVLADPNLPDCPLVYVNPAFHDLTGYTSEEAVGRNCRFLQGPETDPGVLERIRQALAAREVFNEEIYNYRKGGAGFWNALHLSPVFDEDGKLLYYFGSQIDVSAQKEAARRQAQRIESIGALASGVAHEFNNLMTVVMGSVERAADQAADDRQSRHLTNADWAARRAGDLAAELLSLARRQSSAERIINLNELVQAFKIPLEQVAGPTMRLRFDLAPEAMLVRLDAGQLELVLLNLVRNAMDAMAEGGEIVVATRMLQAAEASATLHSKAAVELSVTDTGAGMAPEVAKRATELFFTTKSTGKGTGLGLFLALEFADHSGGKLTIDSEIGRGTTVRMDFPQATEY
jgi:PAS domain S-box-containing protein